MAVSETAIDYLQPAITLMQREDYEEAEKHAEKAISVDKRYKEAYVVKADALVNDPDMHVLEIAEPRERRKPE